MIFNLGSINIDYFYRVPHLARPGETLAATEFSTGLGGKGANQSIAAARAGASVRHIGAVGADGDWAIGRLDNLGVDTSCIAKTDTATGHAVVQIDPSGENMIIIVPGANIKQTEDVIEEALAEAAPGDILMIQNETSHQRFCAEIGSNKGMKIVYAAAPFDVASVQAILPLVHILILNAVEMEQFFQATGQTAAELGVETVIVTKGAKGGFVFRAERNWQAENIAARLL